MNACGMEAVGGKLDQIVAQFAAWVKTLSAQIDQVQDAPALEMLEAQVRQQGQNILWQLFGGLLQEAITRHQESLRACPGCGQTRRHQGVRTRRVLCSLGKLTIAGQHEAGGQLCRVARAAAECPETRGIRFERLRSRRPARRQEALGGWQPRPRGGPPRGEGRSCGDPSGPAAACGPPITFTNASGRTL